MISVIIPVLNEAERLPRTLAPLITATVAGLVREVILVDGGSTDASAGIAAATGAQWLTTTAGRGAQLARGAQAARGPWLLFLHADTVLARGWMDCARTFMEQPQSRTRAAAFRFALDAPEPRARALERLVALRCLLFALPYGDQGLLLGREFYAELGGFRPWPLMEDVDLVRRVGRRRLVMLPARAVTSARRFTGGGAWGFWRRSARNLMLISLYALGVPPRLLVRLALGRRAMGGRDA